MMSNLANRSGGATVAALRPWMVFLACLAMFLAAVGVDAGLAQKSSKLTESSRHTFGAWTVRCGNEKTSCHVLQSLHRSKDKARLMQVTIFRRPAADGQLYLRTLTPLGTLLANGVVLAVDGAAPQNLAYLSCWPRGCVSETRLTDELEKAMREGEALTVTVVSSDRAQPVQFKLSLFGISRALNEL